MQQSIYERLGGAKGITTLVDDIVDAHLNNPVVKARFIPYTEDQENFKKLKGHLCAFLSMGCGGPEQYTGRDMVTAHRGMNINETEYMAVLDDIITVLDKHNIDEQTRKDVIVMAYSLKGEILHV